MLTIITSMKELSFSKLMEVYIEENQRTGHALVQAEQDFYSYLRESFFQTPGAVYCVWQVGDAYVSALRLEPYRDGMLLAALETAPDRRNQGYAKLLVNAVLCRLGDFGCGKIYTHISNDNAPSITVHEGCGFRRELDYAVYIDGSVSHRAGTYVYISPEN